MSPRGQLRCEDIAPLLVFYACEETSEQERRRIEAHIAQCAACAAQLAEERTLHESLVDALRLSEHADSDGILLSQCRSDLAEALDDLSTPQPLEYWQPFGWLRRWMTLRPALSGAFLVLFGLVVGMQLMQRFSGEANSAGQAVNVSPAPSFTKEQLAQMAAGINVTPAPDGASGTLQVHMRTEQPFVLTGTVDDAPVRNVLTYVVTNGEQTDPGVRLDCLEALRGHASNMEVRHALLFAARKDQNPAVRMKALEFLRDAATDNAVREVLVETLERDPNPGVRVEAVNLLVGSIAPVLADAPQAPRARLAPPVPAPPLDPSLERVIRTLQDLQRNDPNRYVRLRSAAALKQIGPRELH
jgi:hypothetical protein